MNLFEKYSMIAKHFNRIFNESKEIIRKEAVSMGRKDNYSFRLSKTAKEYCKFCADMANLSESKFLDILLRSLAAQDSKFTNENKEAIVDDQLS